MSSNEVKSDEIISQTVEVGYNDSNEAMEMTTLSTDSIQSDPIVMIQKAIKQRGVPQPRVGWFVCRDESRIKGI